jgi:multiple sugar transport system substrate-binding protein
MRSMTRRGFVAASGALAAAAATGCARGSGPTTAGQTTLRFAWWGSDQRTKVTSEAVAAFQRVHPEIKVSLEPNPFDGYFDKIATQFAAGDPPDVIQLTPDKVLEFSGRSALADLNSIDQSKIDTRLVDIVRGKDGGLGGLPAGIGAHTLVANPAVFRAAGVELPDDKTWTWTDYADVAQRISDAAPGRKVYGSQAFGWSINGYSVWLTQQGALLWTADGDVGYRAADGASYFRLLQQLVDSGAVPPPEETTEDLGKPLEENGVITGKYALAYTDTSQFSALVAAGSGLDLRLLRFPSGTGQPKDAKMEVRSSMYWVSPASSRHPAEAKQLIDFLVNSDEAGLALLGDRGVPASSTVKDVVLPRLDPAAAEAVEFITDLTPDAGPFVPRAPLGGGSVEDSLQRATSDVLFGKLTPEQGAQRMIDEMKAAIGR